LSAVATTDLFGVVSMHNPRQDKFPFVLIEDCDCILVAELNRTLAAKTAERYIGPIWIGEVRVRKSIDDGLKIHDLRPNLGRIIIPI